MTIDHGGGDEVVESGGSTFELATKVENNEVEAT